MNTLCARENKYLQPHPVAKLKIQKSNVNLSPQYTIKSSELRTSLVSVFAKPVTNVCAYDLSLTLGIHLVSL